MRKISLTGLILFTFTATLPLQAQTTTGSITVPGVGTVSESTLESLGLSDSEIDAVMNSIGGTTTTTTPAVPSATETITSTQQADQQEVTQQENQNTPPDTTYPLTSPAVQPMDTSMQAKDTGEAEVPAPIWGQDFFRNGNIEIYDRVPNARVSDSYILGEGDQVNISIWGYAYYNETFTVSSDGYITTSEVGRIYVKGLTFSAARQLIRQRFSGSFDLKNSNFDITLVYSKSIKVNIVGEVMHPGSYNIASINTAFNALAVAGGPTDIGSVRNIQIKRGGKVVRTLDVYQFMMNPGNTDDAYLEANDYIVVPPIGRVVEVQGEVNRPLKYELVEGENLNELIYYAGGLKSTAYKRNVSIYRYVNNENKVLDINLDSLMKIGKDFELLDGDKVIFAKIPEVVENIVTIEGAVRFPGNYEFTDNMRISDVISKAKGLNYDAYTQRAYLIRKDDKLNDVYIPFNLQDVLNDPNSPFNFKLAKFDVINVFSKEAFRETFNVTISGAVKTPGTFEYNDKMTLKDLLYYAGGLKVEAANNRIEISRIVNFNQAMQQNEPTRVVIETIEVNKNLEISDDAENFILQPYDQVFVRTTPEFELQQNVTLSGEVKYPGTYTLISKTETVADLIERAGGLTQYAYAEGATLTRENTTNILLFLQKALNEPNSKFNYVLREGDVINVPRLGDLVSLKGAIDFPFVSSETPGNAIVVPFDKGRSARWYVKKYGKHFADNADKKETYIIQPNGYVKRTKHILFIKFYPHVKVKGSEVVVPPKPVKPVEPTPPTTPPTPFDWNTFMASLSAGILSFATIYVLIARVPSK